MSSAQKSKKKRGVAGVVVATTDQRVRRYRLGSGIRLSRLEETRLELADVIWSAFEACPGCAGFKLGGDQLRPIEGVRLVAERRLPDGFFRFAGEIQILCCDTGFVLVPMIGEYGFPVKNTAYPYAAELLTCGCSAYTFTTKRVENMDVLRSEYPRPVYFVSEVDKLLLNAIGPYGTIVSPLAVALIAAGDGC